MLEDIIKSAYIDLLTFIACKSSDRITQTDYWTLWPYDTFSVRFNHKTTIDVQWQICFKW
jgi:hypothetical protein